MENTIDYGIDQYRRGYWGWREFLSHIHLNVPTTPVMSELDMDCMHSPKMAIGAAIYALWMDGIVMFEISGGHPILWEKTPAGFIRETNFGSRVYNEFGQEVGFVMAWRLVTPLPFSLKSFA